MKFNIVIEEKLKRVISIEANSSTQAIQKVEELYQKEEIVLDYSDFDVVYIMVEENYTKEKMSTRNL